MLERGGADHLPTETIVHEAPCVCPNCGGTAFGRIGADEREVLEYVPARFLRTLHVRPKMSCRACETIVQAPMPRLPIEKDRPGPGLLAHVAVSKFCDHLPLYRQSEIYGREGVTIDRSVMAGWMGHVAALLAPLAERIGRHVRAGPVVHADMVEGHRIDIDAVERFIEAADRVIAQNAGCDRPFCERLARGFDPKPWGCSVRKVDWAVHGYEGTKLV